LKTRFRQLVFWLHLIAGVVTGVVIVIMSATGMALAFEKEINAWAEREVRQVSRPSPAVQKLPLDELLARLRTDRPDQNPSGITVEANPTAAVIVGFGRNDSVYVNPYTGEGREQGAKRTRAFLQTMMTWHRWLGAGEERRAIGKAITGACNAAFLSLAISGFYLWWPRQWTKQVLRSVGLMNFKLRGKARDFNWHNAVGFWSAPVLIVLTATALPISYRWAGDSINRITGSLQPTQTSEPRGGATPAVTIPTPPPGSKPLGLEALFAAAQREFPKWEQITYRTGGGRGGRRGERRTETASVTTNEAIDPGQPVTLSVKTKSQWPWFSTKQITLDPFTGSILQREEFSDQNLGRKVRSWTRFLHTGEAFGVFGKTVAAIASAGALILVWTGFALSWRRFVGRRERNGRLDLTGG